MKRATHGRVFDSPKYEKVIKVPGSEMWISIARPGKRSDSIGKRSSAAMGGQFLHWSLGSWHCGWFWMRSFSALRCSIWLFKKEREQPDGSCRTELVSSEGYCLLNERAAKWIKKRDALQSWAWRRSLKNAAEVLRSNMTWRRQARE